MFDDLPPFATFTHAGTRNGFEIVYFRAPSPPAPGFLLEGGTAAIEDGAPWSVNYRIAVDDRWHTGVVEATGISPGGQRRLTAEVRGGRWWIDGAERPDLDGCVDVDFESSLVTNTLAVHRLDLGARTPIEAPAAFVRAEDLRVERMEQTYHCSGRCADGRIAFDYTSATFDFACRLVFDGSGLVAEYPGIGRRHS